MKMSFLSAGPLLVASQIAHDDENLRASQPG